MCIGTNIRNTRGPINSVNILFLTGTFPLIFDGVCEYYVLYNNY